MRSHNLNEPQHLEGSLEGGGGQQLHRDLLRAVRDQIVFFNCFDLYYTSPDSSERQYKSERGGGGVEATHHELLRVV